MADLADVCSCLVVESGKRRPSFGAAWGELLRAEASFRAAEAARWDLVYGHSTRYDRVNSEEPLKGTDLVWAGHRRDELELRLAGADYEAIFAAGGGIHGTKTTLFFEMRRASK